MTEKTIWVCDGCGEERDVTRNKQGDWHVVRLTSEGFNGYPTFAPEPTQTARHNLCPKCTTRLYRAINPRLWPSPDAKDQTL